MKGGGQAPGESNWQSCPIRACVGHRFKRMGKVLVRLVPGVFPIISITIYGMKQNKCVDYTYSISRDKYNQSVGWNQGDGMEEEM